MPTRPIVLALTAALVVSGILALSRNEHEGSDSASAETFSIAVGTVTGTPLIEPENPAGDATPAPTEIAARHDENRLRKEDRAAWIESLHRAPGADWRAIDRAHRTALALERYGRIENGERTTRWTEVGSANLAGHSRSASPSADGSTLYVGSANGGVWRGNIDGTGWTAISDGLGYESNEVRFLPAGGGAPEVVHTLASEGGLAQLHSTTDGGATWFVPSGLPLFFYETKRMVQDASEPGRVFLLSRARQSQDQSGGFLVSGSDNNGLDWAPLYLFPQNPRADIWIDRQSGGDLWVLSGNKMYRSTNQGVSFTQVGTVPTTGTINDVILDGSEAGAPSFYAMIKESGTWKLYRSTDAGANWTFRHTPSDMWDQMMVSISNPDVVFYGGVECFRSTNGGGSFTKINHWADYYGDPANRLHADIRGLDAALVGSTPALFFNTDGGTYVSYDEGATVQNLCLYGIGISQYYDTFTSRNDPYLVLGGSQDQGYQQSTPGSGTPYLSFNQLISGDYAHIVSTVRDHNLVFSVYPGFILLQKKETPPQGLLDLGGFPTSSHLWLPPLCADPDDEGTFYFLGDALYRYDRIGTSYSFDITMNPQDFGSGVLAGMAISPADTDYWYLVQDNGQLWYSHDRGATFANPTRGPNGHWFHGTTLVASPHDRNLAYVGGSGYLDHPVWRTTDGGLTWEGIGDGLPNTLVYELVLGGANEDELFAATEVGAFAYDATAGEWTNVMGTEAPLTTYWCVEWVPEINSVRFGTYGRGMWDYELTDPADLADASPDQSRLAFRTSPNPARDRISFEFELAAAAMTRLEIFDIHGRRVTTVEEGMRSAGRHELPYAFGELARGTYLARLRAGEEVAVRKIQVVD